MWVIWDRSYGLEFGTCILENETSERSLNGKQSVLNEGEK